MIQAALALLASLTILSGGASQYAPGVMAQVIANRQAGLAAPTLPAELPSVDGFIAVVDCAEIGNIWYVRPPDGDWERHLVADCAGPELRTDGLTGGEWMRANNILIEISASTAEGWGVAGRGIKVEVARVQ